MTAAPERSYVQRMEALARANDTRTYRSQLKRNLKAGRVDVIHVLLSPDPRVQTMRIWDLLLSIPKWGRAKVNKTITQCKISPSKTIGGLSERQRRELVRWLGQGSRVRQPPVLQFSVAV